LEHHFDRLSPEKLSQAYAVLVPEDVRAVGSAHILLPKSTEQETMNDQSSRYIRARVV
jgi:chemotaxis receptor (MCP) glutamine deamidase CheD